MEQNQPLMSSDTLQQPVHKSKFKAFLKIVFFFFLYIVFISAIANEEIGTMLILLPVLLAPFYFIVKKELARRAERIRNFDPIAPKPERKAWVKWVASLNLFFLIYFGGTFFPLLIIIDAAFNSGATPLSMIFFVVYAYGTLFTVYLGFSKKFEFKFSKANKYTMFLPLVLGILIMMMMFGKLYV